MRSPHAVRAVGLLSIVVVAATALIAGHGAGQPLRAYNESGGWTSEFTDAVARYTTAVESGDATALDDMNGGIGTNRGVSELLATYGGDRLSVTGYDADWPGDGVAYISVDCGRGRTQTYLQPFASPNGYWQAVMYSVLDIPTTEDPLPSGAASSLAPGQTVHAEPNVGLYPTCP